MHTLNFKNKHLSINGFESVSIPDFTVITGINGSGKTHLLKSIESKAISSDAIRDDRRRDRQAVYYNWQNLSPSNDGSSTHDGAKEEERQIESRFNNSLEIRNAKSAAAAFLSKALGSPMRNINLSHLLEYTTTSSQSLEDQVILNREIRSELENILKSYDQPILDEVLRAASQPVQDSGSSLQKPVAAMTCVEFTSTFYR